MTRPRIFLGSGAIHSVRSIMEELQVRHVFLVTGKQSFDFSGTADIIKSALKKYSVTRFCDFQENPKIEDVRRGICLLRESPLCQCR